MTTHDERAKELAEAMKEAAQTPVGAPGLIGGNYLWGIVASRLITMMEEVAREAVDRYLNPPDKEK